jgi:hypothetical protein
MQKTLTLKLILSLQMLIAIIIVKLHLDVLSPFSKLISVAAGSSSIGLIILEATSYASAIT